jgi:RhtB (resistance to homoserine/threonine) family protein
MVSKMETILTLTGILLAVLVGAMSPGPSFLLVARTAMSGSRRNGVAAAVGMGIGAIIFAVLALLGLKAILTSIPWLYMILKLIGGTYLVYLGIKIWRGAKEPLGVELTDTEGQKTWRRAFITALFTQLSNPKTTVFYGSIFASLLPQAVPLPITLALPICVLFVETGWYSVVAVLLSSTAPRAAYLRSKVWIDRTAGGVMGLLGIKLITSRT